MGTSLWGKHFSSGFLVHVGLVYYDCVTRMQNEILYPQSNCDCISIIFVNQAFSRSWVKDGETYYNTRMQMKFLIHSVIMIASQLPSLIRRSAEVGYKMVKRTLSIIFIAI